MSILGKIFTWWDGATVGTLLNSWSRTGVERGRADAHISDGPVSGAQWRDFLAADGHAQRLRTSSQDLWILCVGWNRVGFARRHFLFEQSFVIAVIDPQPDCVGGCQHDIARKIGRASCRDRVCQSV